MNNLNEAAPYIDLLSQAVLLVDPEGQILQASQAAANLLGYEPAALLQQNVRGLLPPALVSQHATAAQAWFCRPHLLRIGPTSGFCLRHRDGRELPVEFEAAPWSCANQTVALVLLRAATEQVGLLTAWRDSEQRYHQLLAAVTDYTYTVSVQDGRAVATVHGAASVAVTGYSPAEYQADPYLWHRMVHPEDRAAVSEQARQALAGVAVPPLEHRVRHKDGSLRWLRNVIVLRHDPHGRLIGYDGLISEITSRKHLEEQRRILARAVEQADDAVVITDPTGVVEYVNPAFEQRTGFGRAEVLQQPLAWLQPGQSAPQFHDRLWRTLLGGEVFRAESVIRHKSGAPLIADQSITPMKDALGRVTHLVVVWRDVTEQKQLQQAILEISEREQARIGQDLHDGLCQHLVGTAFAVQHLAQCLPARTPRHVGLAVQRIAGLLEDAIQQARVLARGLYPIKLESDGFVAALEDLVLRSQHLFQVSCVLECAPDITLSDPIVTVHLYRIAQEALTNAAKHAQARRIRLQLSADPSGGRLSVIDDGIGLATGGDKRGMGLRIMQYRARMIGGELQIGPAPGGGTMVCCHWHQDSAWENSSP